LVAILIMNIPDSNTDFRVDWFKVGNSEQRNGWAWDLSACKLNQIVRSRLRWTDVSY